MSSRKALILGYGFTGQAIDRALTSAGYETLGVRRDWSNKRDENLHSQPLEANITEPQTLADLPEDVDVVVNCVAAGSRGDADRYREVYYEGSEHLLNWASQIEPALILWTGSSSVYGKRKGEWVDETSDLLPDSEAAEWLVKTEQLYREAAEEDLRTQTFRVSGIYGPGRARTPRKFEGGVVSMTLEEANYYMNMIHRTDIGRAVAAAAEDPNPGEIYNLVDNKPVTKRRFYVWFCQQLDEPLPEISGGSSVGYTNKRVSNEKFVDTYDFEFQYPTFREGYGEVLGESYPTSDDQGD